LASSEEVSDFPKLASFLAKRVVCPLAWSFGLSGLSEMLPTVARPMGAAISYWVALHQAPQLVYDCHHRSLDQTAMNSLIFLKSSCGVFGCFYFTFCL
jgi:hypothetical protein